MEYIQQIRFIDRIDNTHHVNNNVYKKKIDDSKSQYCEFMS